MYNHVEYNNESEVDFDIYAENIVENYLDEDEISAIEEGFMKGYLSFAE